MIRPAVPAAAPRRALAAVVDALGPPAQSLHVREVDVGEPGTGQVLVRVEYASVNFPDVLIVRRGRYEVWSLTRSLAHSLAAGR
jgi:NADPH:quinone reductase-like Zn-dependent oxidoreductase